MTSPRMIKFVLPVAILLVGLGSARFLISQKKQTEKKAPEARVATVEYVEVTAGAPRSRIEATGTVEGDRQVSLSSLVAGEVVYVANDLDPGGRFRKGATLHRVARTDYELAVAQEASRVQQAELELALEQQRGETAAREWALLGEGRDPSEAPLALRQRGVCLAACQCGGQALRSLFAGEAYSWTGLRHTHTHCHTVHCRPHTL